MTACRVCHRVVHHPICTEAFRAELHDWGFGMIDWRWPS